MCLVSRSQVTAARGRQQFPQIFGNRISSASPEVGTSIKRGKQQAVATGDDAQPITPLLSAGKFTVSKTATGKKKQLGL